MEWSRYNRLFRSERFGPFVYNALSNTLLELDEAHYRALEALRLGGSGADAGADGDFLTVLREHKVLLEPREEERLLAKRRAECQTLRSDPSVLHLTLCPTLQCNFRCSYCFERSQQDVRCMSSETAARVVAFIRQHTEARRLSIAWFGGEPLLAFETICSISEKVQALDVEFEGARLVTNGYLLDGEKIARLDTLKITSIVITLDGPQRVHDRRRVLAGGGATFQRIMGNVAALMESPYTGHCTIRVNLDRHNLDRFVDLHAALRGRFTADRLSIQPGYLDTSIADGYGDRCGLSLQEWTEFAFELHRKGVLPASVGFHPSGSLAGACVAMAPHWFVIGPEGELYKCWADVGKQAMVVGNVHAEEPITNRALWTQYCATADQFGDPICRTCDALPICDGGCTNRRLRARHVGESGFESCSPYRSHLASYLEAYYDAFRSRELRTAFLRPGAQDQNRQGYRVVSPQR